MTIIIIIPTNINDCLDSTWYVFLVFVLNISKIRSIKVKTSKINFKLINFSIELIKEKPSPERNKSFQENIEWKYEF